MDKKNAREIYQRYLSGKLSPEEEALVKQWLMLGSFPESELSEEEISASLDTISARLDLSGKKVSTVKTVPLWKRAAVAAAVVIAISVGIGIYRYSSGPAAPNVQLAAGIAPGTNGATLTLASGRKIRLANAGKGELAKEAGIAISKTARGEIVYTVLDAGTTTAENPSAYNTLSTANGETYSVVLPDGSKVWLNAASSLKYPTSFASLKERRVELSGEGYFEITKVYAAGSQAQRIPFIVKTASQEVKVLGTHFNINAYADEPSVKTTLLEGSVMVKSLKTGSERKLVPGQQAIGNSSGEAGRELSVSEVDSQDAVAWKQGKFIFVNEDIQSIMRKLSRWYNVTVSYQSVPEYNEFSGSMGRFENIEKVLNKIEQTNKVHFKLQGRRVIVMK